LKCANYNIKIQLCPRSAICEEEREGIRREGTVWLREEGMVGMREKEE